MFREFKGDILDVEILAKILGVCKMTIYRYLKMEDPLPGHKVRGKILFFKEEVEAWIKGKR